MQPTNPLITLPNVQPDPLDPNDTLYVVDYSLQLPLSVDMRSIAPPIEDQTSVGDCTANAAIGNCGFFLQAAGKFTQLAEDFNYYTSRYLLNGSKAPTGDTGSTPGMALKALRQYGVCKESTWPISTVESVFNSQPSMAAYAEAAEMKVVNYQRIANPNNPPIWFNSDNWWFGILHAVAKGFPVNIAFNVGQMIYAITGDELYLPISTTNPWIGAHDVLIIGYTMDDQSMTNLKLLCRNSWGTAYADKGNFWMSSSVLTGDVFSAYVQQDFAGHTVIAPDTTKAWPTPTSASTMQDVVDYVFKTKFGRLPQPAGEQFWANAVSTWLVSAIIGAAQAADLAYMAAHPVSVAPTFSDTTTIAACVDTVFQTYFGRAPQPAGLEFWAADALTKFTVSIVAAAGARDLAYMSDNNISNSPFA